MALAPGKGYFGDATMKTAEFLSTALEEIQLVMSSEYTLGDEQASADDLIDAGSAKYLIDCLLSVEGWQKEVDKFGLKAYKELPWKDGAYRVTLALTARGSLNIDVRNWYNPDPNHSRWSR